MQLPEALAKNEARRRAIVEAFANDADLAIDCPGLVLIASDTETLAEQLDRRIQVMRNRSNDEDKKKNDHGRSRAASPDNSRKT